MDIGSIFGTSPAVPQTPAVDMPAAAQPTLVNPPAASSLLTPSAMPGAVPVTPQVTHRRFGDSIGTRKAIYDSVLNAARAFAPATNNQYTLGLQNVDYDGRDNFTKAEQKKAILSGATLGRSLRGDWVLTDPTGAEVSRKRALLARVPHMTERGTFIVNGSEYSLAHQMRLRPGIYTRQQENGEIEAHVNVKSGRAHKLFLDPATGIFRIKIGQARIPLVPLLKTMGVTDKQLRESWGDLAAVNQQKSDPQALKKLYERVRSTGTDTDPEAQAKSVAEAFLQMELDPDVTKRTLGQAFTRVGPDSILATTRKLLAVSRGEQEPDDRDSMAYQSLMGPEDLFAERITKAKNIARNLLWKSTARRGIDHIPAGVLTNALQSTLTMSGLGQALEEINTAEILDHQSRVTRRGEGGIQDASAIPMECHSADTEVFTSEGWVPWPEVSITTKFACKVNDRLEFHAASRLFCGEYVGRMYGLQTRTISYLVTPNHRMWCRKYRGGSSVRRCGFAPWGFASAAEVHRRAREFEITHLPAAGRNPRIFTVPCVDGARVQYAFDFNDWAELVGWYVAEGSINRHMLRVESKYQITLLQGPESHPDRVERISALLTRMGISFSFHERRFIFTSKQLGRWFEQCGIGELNKRLPEECFTWSAESRRRLLEAACLGNGSQKTNGVRTYCSNSLQLMRGISRLMLSLGTATREHTSTRRGSKEHRGRTITIRNDAHTCRELLSQYQGATSTPAYDNYFIQEYAGNVYCAEVPGGLLLTRRNKHVGLWLGNSRSVNPSQLGLIDYLRTPESLSAGIDVRLARNAMKGSDGRLYTKVINAKSGLTEVKSANDIADGTLAFSGELQSGKLYVNVLQNGKIRTVPREAVDYELPDTESSFSPLGNLIPFKSSVKGQRSVMGSRFLTQALPLENAEAPLVQSGIPGQVDRSFEQEYGTHMGALRSPQGGVVTKVTPEAVEVRYEDGTKETHELYVNHPMNRKTLIHQTPTVRPGQTFKQGDLLARSNYTDHEGTTALGMNARVAYLPDEGYNYEDAISISESFSKRMRSQHAYQHQHEWEPGDHQGKKAFISMFPSQYTKKQLDKFDDSGVVKQGETLHYGDPMILIASERERNKKSLVRSRTSFSDKSITWEHHSPGIVTDVVQTAKGPAVVVKSYASMQAADKLAGRVGDKGIISRIIPDDQMPVGEDGKPMEVLLNPLGLTSRTNPMQMIEAALGKIAAKTGKPFRMPDFQNSQDLVEMALAKLKEHNMSDTETVTLADGRKVKGVPVGNRWFMKLHHMADDKIQGRGLGAYDAEGAPQKGGQEGGKSKRVGMLEQNALLSHGACFMGSVNVLTEDGPVEISQIVGKRMPVQVACMDVTTRKIVYRRVVDWFCKCVPVEELIKLEVVAAANSRVKAVHRAIHCTRGHEIYLAAGGKAHAGNLQAGDGVLTIGTYLAEWQKQMLDGMLLGDASIGVLPNGNASGLGVAHGHAQRPYLDWKYALLSNIASKPPKAGKLHPKGFAKVPTSRFVLRRHPEIMVKHTEFYTQLPESDVVPGIRRQVKVVPVGIVARMGWLGIGVWFGDDGGCVVVNKTGYIAAVRFHTNAFSVEEVQRLAVEMQAFTNLPWRMYLQNGKYPILTLGNGDGTHNNKGTENVKQFLDMLQPYLPPMLGHKIRRDTCGEAWSGLCVPQGAWAEPAIVKSQQPYTPAPYENCLVYNITVEEHHNYIVHGVVVGNTAVMNEDMRIKGQSSPEYWARYMSGYKPETPKVPFVYNKFVNQLRASGINVVRQGERSHIMAMTAKTVDDLVGDRELQNAETVNWKNMEPMKGGLFDPTLTGGHGGTAGGGNKWSFIRLHQPLPNPVMEEPIRHILGLTQKKLQDVIGGKEQLNGKTGAAAIGAALAAINLPRALENARADIKSGKKTLRDKAVRRLGYLKTCERLGTHPKDWMMDKVPVLPPAFRPVSVMGAKKLPLVADPNYLYKDLFQLNQMHKELAQQLDPDALGDEQAAVYNAFKAVTGLGDPVGIKNQERGVKGILASVFGSSPKYGVMNRKLLSSTVDMVGRGVIAPDPNLTLDETGIPETAAWDVFGPSVVRRMVRAGVSRQKAVQSVKDQLPAAKQYLQKEMDEGVVILSRAPTLHRYGTMAFRPKLIKGAAIKMNPLVNKGFGADFDGDQMNFRALTTDEAKQEALQKMLPSVNLFSTANFKADMNVPSQEYVAGLYQASKNSDTETPPAVFATAADAIRAFRSGKLGFDRRIQILES